MKAIIEGFDWHTYMYTHLSSLEIDVHHIHSNIQDINPLQYLFVTKRSL